jgi:hypothetical protein
MAKLVDALVSGTSVSNDVQVRVLFWALKWFSAQSAEQRAVNPELKALSPELKWRRAQSAERREVNPELKALSPELNRPDGEIGRHASLRGWCSQGCASSSLVLGTKKEADIQPLFFCPIVTSWRIYFISISQLSERSPSLPAVNITFPDFPVGLIIARHRPW